MKNSRVLVLEFFILVDIYIQIKDVMKICGCELKPEWLFKVVAEYYKKKGYSFDEYDKENNLITIDVSLYDIIEKEDEFLNTKAPNEFFCASGYLKIPYTIFSKKKEQIKVLPR